MKIQLKFWQKAFLCVLMCFLIGFDVTAYMIVQKSYEMSNKNEIASADNEFFIIKKSVSDRIQSVSHYYSVLNADNIQQYIEPYAQYYMRQKVYFALYQNDLLVYTNFVGDLPRWADRPFARGEKYIQFYNSDHKQYLIIASYLDISDSDFMLAYIKDEESLMSYQQDIAGYVIKVGIAVSMGLSVLLILMLLNLTHPIRILNKAANEIADGNYHRRAEIKSSDEIGEFSKVFNGMADNIEKHVEELSYITEEKQRFIDNLSHEMRTPVAAILGYGELLKNADIGEEDRLMATDYIISQSLRIQKLSAKLLELSSIKTEFIQMEPIQIRPIFERVLNKLGAQSKEKKIRLEVNLEIASVSGDADLLESLFQNLIENAIRVLPQDGIIKIYSANADNRVCVSIEDNGPGIPKEDLKKIFEPFYRLDKARTRKHGGAGLGLSICRQICDKLNAELSITSEQKIGTQVKIYFTT